jgi:hypothetical protein
MGPETSGIAFIPQGKAIVLVRFISRVKERHSGDCIGAPFHQIGTDLGVREGMHPQDRRTVVHVSNACEECMEPGYVAEQRRYLVAG